MSTPFPDEEFTRLITKGFWVIDTFDYAALLMVLLMNGAGLPPRQVIGLKRQEVMLRPYEGPDEAALWCEVVATGLTHCSDRPLTPELKPTALMASPSPSRARAKAPPPLLWLPPLYGLLFGLFWQRYEQRRRQMITPYEEAFIRVKRSSESVPYTLKHLRSQHEAACLRIGLDAKTARYSLSSHCIAYTERQRRLQHPASL